MGGGTMSQNHRPLCVVPGKACVRGKPNPRTAVTVMSNRITKIDNCSGRRLSLEYLFCVRQAFKFPRRDGAIGHESHDCIRLHPGLKFADVQPYRFLEHTSMTSELGLPAGAPWKNN